MTKEMIEDSIPCITTFYIPSLLGTQINRNVPCNITLGPHRFTVHSLPRSVEATLVFDTPVSAKGLIKRIRNMASFIFSRKPITIKSMDYNQDGILNVEVIQFEPKKRWAKNFYKMQGI